MNVWLAASCLQGRPLDAALHELNLLAPAGIQLTPGCVPAPGDQTYWAGAQLRTHHGFSWTHYRTPVWGPEGLLVRADSVHPPRNCPPDWLQSWCEGALNTYGAALEVMYPGYGLGTGAEVEQAMAAGIPLAVDISHVYLQICAGAMGQHTWRRLQSYTGLVEVHVSANSGRNDSHQPINGATFGLDWARAQTHVPIILECYLHRLSPGERQTQLDYLRR